MDLNYSYISAELKPEYIGEVYAKLGEAGVQVPKHDLHATLVYDERKLEAPLAELFPSREFTAHITKIEPLGDGIVFHLTSKDLLEEFRRLKEAGYQHAYGTPLFHMSVAYDFDKYEVMAINSVFTEWPGRELVFWKEAFGLPKPKKD